MLEIHHISKSYEGKPLLKDISFTVAEGETVCLLGASGSGKSTLLQIIAGLEDSDSGLISFNGMDLASTPPHLRDFGLVFQDYSLFPHLNVNDNVAFGLRMRRIGQAEISRRVANSLETVNLSGFGNRGVAELSGGEQQRVALARALAIRPRLLMFDEPLGALDRALRDDLLDELRTILKKAGNPAVYVTHDQEEAFALADRVLILHGGRIIRDGTPAEVWANPGSVFEAGFLGLGNVFDGRVIAKNFFQTKYGVFTVKCGHKHRRGDEVHLLARPQPAGANAGAGVLRGVVADVTFRQDHFKVTFESGGYVFVGKAPKIGQKITARVKVECLG